MPCDVVIHAVGPRTSVFFITKKEEKVEKEAKVEKEEKVEPVKEELHHPQRQKKFLHDKKNRLHYSLCKPFCFD